MDFEKIGGHNAAVRGYILRMLVDDDFDTDMEDKPEEDSQDDEPEEE